MDQIDREIALKPYHSIIPARLNFQLTKPTMYSDAEFDAAIESGKWVMAHIGAGYGSLKDGENMFVRTLNSMISNLNLNGFITRPGIKIDPNDILGVPQVQDPNMIELPKGFEVDADKLDVGVRPSYDEAYVKNKHAHERATYVGFSDSYDYCKTCGEKL